MFTDGYPSRALQPKPLFEFDHHFVHSRLFAVDISGNALVALM
jgi:hypothetical protein